MGMHAQDIAVQDVITQLNERFQKDYARTTVVTFLGNKWLIRGI